MELTVKIGLTPKPNNLGEYEFLDVVSTGGSSYISLVNNNTYAIEEGLYWQKATIGAYDLAFAAGYTGTEAEFALALAEVDNKIKKDGTNSNIDTLHFNPETLQELANIGDVRYSPDSKTLEVKITDTCTIQVGQEMTARVKKGEVNTMLNGKVVYISGALGANPVAKYASTSDPDVAQRTFAVLTEDNPDFGIATTEGLVRGINTDGIDEGSLLWLSTNGNFTAVEPVSPTPKICIGMCLRESATVGVIYVKIRAIPRLAKLSDVFTSTLTEGDILRYDATSGRFEQYNLDTALALKIDKTSITSELGDSEELVMSQKGVSDEIKIPVENGEQAAAAALVELKKEVAYLREVLSNVITYLQINTLSVDNLQIKGAPLFIFSDVVPAVIPDFAGQIYIKTTATTAAWIALGDLSVANWKEI